MMEDRKELLRISCNHLMNHRLFLVGIEPFAIVSFCLECLSRRRLFARFRHMLWRLALSCHLRLIREGLLSLRLSLVGLANLFRGQGFYNRYVTRAAFDCFLWDQLINLNN